MIHETELAASPLRERLWFCAVLALGIALAYPAIFGFLPPQETWLADPPALMWAYARNTITMVARVGELAANQNGSAILSFVKDDRDTLARWIFLIVASLTPALHMRAWARLTTSRSYKARIISGLAYYEGYAATKKLRAKLNAVWRKADSSIVLAPGVPLPRKMENRTFLAIGLPGGGKSTFINHIALQAWRRGDKIIMHDTDGDVVAHWPGAFFLLNPLNPHSHAWNIAADTIGEIAAREVMAQFVPVTGNGEPHWPRGAQEIGVGVLRTLEVMHGKWWGFAEWRDANDLPPVEFREFATRHHRPAAAFLALEGEEFTKTANSYVTTYSAQMNTIVRPLAEYWGDIDQPYRVALRRWLADDQAKIRTLILQRAADKPAISEAWLPVVLGIIAGFCASPHMPSSKTRRIFAILDEFPQMGKVEKFTQMAEVGRKKGLCCLLAMQNLGQLEERYSKAGMNNFLDLAAFKLIFRLEPGPTSETVCSQLIPPSRFLYQPSSQSSTPSEEKLVTMPVVDAAELARLEHVEDVGVEGVLIHGGGIYRLFWNFPIMPRQRP
jgi:hypothetical protein